MFRFDELCGMSYAEVEDALSLELDFLIAFASTGEAIYLAAEWPEGDRKERVFIVLVNLETESVTQLWELPTNSHSLHPTMFME